MRSIRTTEGGRLIHWFNCMMKYDNLMGSILSSGNLRVAYGRVMRQFWYSRLGGWRIACSPIMGTTVTEARLRMRGFGCEAISPSPVIIIKYGVNDLIVLRTAVYVVRIPHTCGSGPPSFHFGRINVRPGADIHHQ
jgi:hypothetical protein